MRVQAPNMRRATGMGPHAHGRKELRNVGSAATGRSAESDGRSGLLGQAARTVRSHSGTLNDSSAGRSWSGSVDDHIHDNAAVATA